MNRRSRTIGTILGWFFCRKSILHFFFVSSFIIDVLAPKYGAAIYFVEHRYFGKTMPCKELHAICSIFYNRFADGKQSFDKPNIGYLSTEQALADYALFLEQLKQRWGLQKNFKLNKFITVSLQHALWLPCVFVWWWVYLFTLIACSFSFCGRLLWRHVDDVFSNEISMAGNGRLGGIGATCVSRHSAVQVWIETKTIFFNSACRCAIFGPVRLPLWTRVKALGTRPILAARLPLVLVCERWHKWHKPLVVVRICRKNLNGRNSFSIKTSWFFQAKIQIVHSSDHLRWSHWTVVLFSRRFGRHECVFSLFWKPQFSSFSLSLLAMLDYPYAANYGVAFPAWPVNTTCSDILQQSDIIEGKTWRTDADRHSFVLQACPMVCKTFTIPLVLVLVLTWLLMCLIGALEMAGHTSVVIYQKKKKLSTKTNAIYTDTQFYRQWNDVYYGSTSMLEKDWFFFFFVSLPVFCRECGGLTLRPTFPISSTAVKNSLESLRDPTTPPQLFVASRFRVRFTFSVLVWWWSVGQCKQYYFLFWHVGSLYVRSVCLYAFCWRRLRRVHQFDWNVVVSVVACHRDSRSRSSSGFARPASQRPCLCATSTRPRGTVHYQSETEYINFFFQLLCFLWIVVQWMVFRSQHCQKELVRWRLVVGKRHGARDAIWINLSKKGAQLVLTLVWSSHWWCCRM